VESAGAIEKAVDVLFHLHACDAPQGVTAIGRALGLPKSSAHRLLRSLGRRGLVERDAGGHYRPGIGLVALGLGALEREPAVAAARPVLEAEAEAVGETFFLVVARAGRLVVLDKVEGTGFLRAAPRVGQVVPVHATAVGKLFLAFGGVELPRGRLERFTSRTRVEPGSLEREVACVRERGFAENREEWIPGLHVLAAPILGVAGTVAPGALRGAVAVAAPTARMRALGRDEVGRRTIAAARRVAGRLEGSAT
jgi:IclR family acetate operon transcriptional repressor